MRKLFLVPASVAIILMGTPLTWADGDGGTPSAYQNAVQIDGSTNPGTTLNKLIRGTIALVSFSGIGSGTLTLADPDGRAVGTSIASNGVVLFENVNLAKTGWWTLKAAGVVTKFEVIPFDNNLAVGLPQLMISELGQYDLLCSVGGFTCVTAHTQNVFFNAPPHPTQPTCGVTGFSEARQLSYNSNLLNIRVTFKTHYQIFVDESNVLWTLSGSTNDIPRTVYSDYAFDYREGDILYDDFTIGALPGDSFRVTGLASLYGIAMTYGDCSIETTPATVDIQVLSP